MLKSKTAVIILAAGKGTRFASKLPKVMVPVAGEPMVRRVLKSVEVSLFRVNPVVVVGYKQELIRQALGSRARYAHQRRQLGTAHAVATAMPLLSGNTSNIVVVYGDHPLLSAATLKRLVATRQRTRAVVALVTVQLKDFSGPRRAFRSFSRIVRDTRGKFVRDVQVQDASAAERRLREINPCFYCFDARWLRAHLPLLNRQNAQREYYLTDLLALAVAEQKKIAVLRTRRWQEALGVNSPADLRVVELLTRSYD